MFLIKLKPKKPKADLCEIHHDYICILGFEEQLI